MKLLKKERVTISYNLLQFIIVHHWTLTLNQKSQNYRKAGQEFQEPTCQWTIVAISNVPWFATTVEGPFGVGTGGIFATIVRDVQAFV